MKIAHLILAHKNPAQLERLIRAMKHPAFHFYIHVDKKSDIGPFEYLFDNQQVFKVQHRTSIVHNGHSENH